MIQTDKDFRKKGSKIAIIPILTLVFSVVAPMSANAYYCNCRNKKT